MLSALYSNLLNYLNGIGMNNINHYISFIFLAFNQKSSLALWNTMQNHYAHLLDLRIIINQDSFNRI
jgi:hypothetical protein